MEKNLDEIKERTEKGQDDLKNSFKEKISTIDEKIAGRINEKIGEVQAQICDAKTKVGKIEEKLQNEIICAKQEIEEKMVRKIEKLEENFSLVYKKIQDFEKKLESTRANSDDYKIMSAFLIKVKLYTYNEKSR